MSTYTGSIYGNGTTTATSGANTITHFYDRLGLKAAIQENVFSMHADRRFLPKRYGKTYKVSKWLHILDDNNVNDQGLDTDGNVSTGQAGYKAFNVVFLTMNYADGPAALAAATAYATLMGGDAGDVITITALENNGNAYGSSRDVGYVTSNMPTLAEGATAVNRVGVTKITVEATLQRFGNYIEYTDEIEKFSEDNVQIHYREELGYMAGQVFDDLVQIDMLNGAGIVAYAGSATSRDTIASTDLMNDNDAYNLIRKVTKQLFINKAKKTTSIIDGTTKIDTKTVNAGWAAFVGPDVKYDLESVVDGAGESAWIPAYRYAAAGKVMKGEVGAIHDTRFVEAPRMMHWADAGAAGAVDVHAILWVTPESFATVGLQGEKKIVFKSKAPGAASSSDVYGLRGLFSYNFFYAGIVLQPEKIARIECAATV